MNNQDTTIVAWLHMTPINEARSLHGLTDEKAALAEWNNEDDAATWRRITDGLWDAAMDEGRLVIRVDDWGLLTEVFGSYMYDAMYMLEG